MIISKNIEITASTKTLKYLKNLGYNVKLKEKIKIPIQHLLKGSQVKIKVKCDICGLEKELSYKEYNNSIKKYNLYSCSSKCSKFKNKLTCKEKYNDENFNNREKSIKTLKKVNWKVKNENIKKKRESTNIKKYKVENVSQIKNVKEKRKKTMLTKYNVEYYVLSDDFKEKSKKTSLLNYGVEHPMMSDTQKEKFLNTLRLKGMNISDDNFHKYKRKVYNLTKKHKLELLENWNGYDFYDNEFIKDNLKLQYYHKNYPTIDHKISIFEGYKNNISEEKLSKISNLCITKRCINSSKGKKLDWN